MTLQMGLTGSAVLFVGLHFLLSHPLRRPLVRAVGERAFQGIYSLISILTFGAMVYFYHAIGREPPLWTADSDAIWIIASLLMWFGAILFIGSFIRNPALVGSRGPAGGPSGVLTITRHPMMWSFAIWATVHLTLIAMPKALVFDGAIIVLALFGAAGQDKKKARQLGENWHEWRAQTAFVPFARGFGYPGVAALFGGTVLFFAATWLHPIPAGFWRWIA